MKRVDWADLDAFAVVAFRRNFRRAALELGVSAITLSRTMSALEDRLGMRLLERTTRGIAPTEAANKLLRRLTPALAEIASAIDHLESFRGTPSGLVRINAPFSIVEFVIAPLISPFMQANPRIKLEVIANDGFIDIVKDGFDAGIRFGHDTVDADMIAVPVATTALRYVLVASPDFVASHGPLRDPSELIDQALIVHRCPSGNIFPWRFEKNGEKITFTPCGFITLNDPRVETRVAIDGAGYLFTLDRYVNDAVGVGHLIKVLEDWYPAMQRPYIYYPQGRNTPPALRALLDFMRDKGEAN